MYIYVNDSLLKQISFPSANRSLYNAKQVVFECKNKNIFQFIIHIYF